jgi:hypothetical protein
MPGVQNHRVQFAVFRQPFDRGDVLAFGLHGKHVAGFDRAAVQMNRARAALRGIAADVRSCQPQLFS